MLVPGTISAEPYRKALIVKLFTYEITVLSNNSSVSFSDRMSAVASYLRLSTEFAKRKAEGAVISIDTMFPLVSSL